MSTHAYKYTYTQMRVNREGIIITNNTVTVGRINKGGFVTIVGGCELWESKVVTTGRRTPHLTHAFELCDGRRLTC